MRSDSPLIRYGLPAGAGLLALGLLVLAWPRFQASYRYLPVEIAIDKYFKTHVIPSNRLPVLIRYAHQAISYQDNYHYHDGLSVLHLLRAQDALTPALERRKEYEDAALAAKASLERAPAQSATWLRLAWVGWVLHEEPEDILSAWKMSIFTGRTHSGIMIERLEVGLAHREFMDEEALSMLRDQLLLAWRMHAGSLIRLLHSRDRQLAVTRELIANSDPAALSEMEAWLERLR